MVVPKSETLSLTVFCKNRSIQSQTLGISLLKRREARLPVIFFSSAFWRSQSPKFASIRTLRRPKAQARVSGCRECRPLLKASRKYSPDTPGREKAGPPLDSHPSPLPTTEAPASGYSGAGRFSPSSAPAQEKTSQMLPPLSGFISQPVK